MIFRSSLFRKNSFSRVNLLIFAIIFALFGGYLIFKSFAATTLNTHTVVLDGSSKIVSWVSPQDQAYANVSELAWNYLLNSVPNDPSTGKPAYLSQSYLDPNTQQVANWPHNPAGLYSMLIESAAEYYQYSGDSRVLQLAKNVADQQLATGMTTSTDSWASVPYSSGDAGSLTYKGAAYGNSTGSGDGTGVLQPDKIGEIGHGFVTLYKITGDSKYLTAAINSANALVSHVRTGSASQSPWPFRVVASNNTIKEQYTAHVISPIELFDDLIALNAGNVSGYQTTRTTAWNWLMTYPMQNNVWTQYFEDVSIQSTYSSNLNQYNAMMTARYLLQHPEKDASWESHVRGLITWVENNFATASSGANTIKEQFNFDYPMGSHTSRYASVNALLYEKTGDLAAKEKAYRSYNWATYMMRSNGIGIDGPQVNNQWFTDSYGDYIRHFMVGMGAVAEWAPNGQTHLLKSTSVVKTSTYTASSLSYTTFDANGTEKIKVINKPTAVSLNGSSLAEHGDLNSEGWVYDSAANAVSIRRDSGTTVVISLTSTTDTTPPNTTITSNPASPTTSTSASFSFTSSEGGSTFECKLDSGAYSGCISPKSYSGLSVASHTFSVRATDAAGNTDATPDTYTWTITAAIDTTPPVISNIVAGSINQNGGSITWTTNEPATSQIEYGLTTAYGLSTPLNSSLDTSHSQVVSGLDANTTYHYRIRSADAAGNTAVSSDKTFHTTGGAAKPGDIDVNSAVDITDLSYLLSSYNQNTTACVTNVSYTCDIKSDSPPSTVGKVDIFDLSVLLSNYGL
jgi:hypothetical protein